MIKKVLFLFCLTSFAVFQVRALDWMTQAEFDELCLHDQEAAVATRYKINQEEAKAYLMSLNVCGDDNKRLEYVAKSCFAALSAINIGGRMWCQYKINKLPPDEQTATCVRCWVQESMKGVWEPAAIVAKALATDIKTKEQGLLIRLLTEQFDRCLDEVAENDDAKRNEIRAILNAFLTIYHQDMPFTSDEPPAMDIFDELVANFPRTTYGTITVLSIINYFILGAYGPGMFEQYFADEAEHVCGDDDAMAYCSVKPAAAVALTGFQMAMLQRVLSWLYGESSTEWWSEVRTIIGRQICYPTEADNWPLGFWQCWEKLYSDGRVIDLMCEQGTESSTRPQEQTEQSEGEAVRKRAVRFDLSANTVREIESGESLASCRNDDNNFGLGCESLSGAREGDDLEKINTALDRLSHTSQKLIRKTGE